MSLPRGLLLLALIGLTRHADAGPSRMSADAWRQDLRFLASEMERLHPDLFYAVTREELAGAVFELDQAIPELDDDEILVGLFRIAALPTLKGHDGHSGMFAFDPGLRAFLPLELYLFTDGVFIVDAMSAYEDLIGTRVVSMDGVAIADVMKALKPLISRDGPPNVRSKIAAFLVSSQLLHGVGVIEDVDQVDLEVERPDGSRFPIAVTSVTSAEFGGWANPRLTLPEDPKLLYLSRTTEGFWSTVLPESKTLYVQYNSVVEETQSGESLEDFSRRLLQTARSGAVERVVVDVRHNFGGDNTTFGPLISAMADPAVNRRGRLFLIMGRTTFSAAGNFVTTVEQRTLTLKVGEATGGAPNQFGDSERIQLPNSRYLGAVSTVYHQRSAPDDPRLTHEPDIDVPLSSEEYFSRVDPAMEAILSYRP